MVQLKLQSGRCHKLLCAHPPGELRRYTTHKEDSQWALKRQRGTDPEHPGRTEKQKQRKDRDQTEHKYNYNRQL